MPEVKMAKPSLSFGDCLRSGRPLLTEGAVIERLRRDPQVRLDPDCLHAAFVLDPASRAALEAVYQDYLDAAREHGLPVSLGTATWHADPRRLPGRPDRRYETLIAENVALLAALRAGAGDFARHVLIAGLLGPSGDAYDPADALEAGAAAEYHARQAAALADAGADFLLASTVPAASEALGLARAMSRAGPPYVVSFIVRPAGTLLDGTPLTDAITTIDAAVDPPPACYWVNCVHPSVFAQAIEASIATAPWLTERLIGLQANTSSLPPESLEGAEELHAAEPDHFAEEMTGLYNKYGTRALGGCCGTDGRHIRAIARRLAAGL
jgi:homocysteine S-methyltransferase